MWTSKLEDLKTLIAKQNDLTVTSTVESMPELLTFPESAKLIGISTYVLRKAIGFPKPVFLGDGNARYLKTEVIAWYNARIAARSTDRGGM